MGTRGKSYLGGVFSLPLQFYRKSYGARFKYCTDLYDNLLFVGIGAFAFIVLAAYICDLAFV